MNNKNYFLTAAIAFYLIFLSSLVPFLAYITTKFTAWAIICPVALISAIVLTVVYAKLRKKDKAISKFKQEHDFLTKKTEQKATKELAGNNKVNHELDKAFDEALKTIQNRTDFPAPNIIRLVNENIEFFAEGRYVCEKDFKNVPGHHFAFEINSTGLKYMPEDYNDVCDLESVGVLVAVGYHDGEPLEKYANDNGIILQDTLENSVGQTIGLKSDNGYSFYVRTAEYDDGDIGFVKILKCKDDVVTVYFIVNVPFGLNGMVEGTIELKKETDEDARDINSLISKIKRNRFNTIDVSDEEIEEITQANPFLPESYITFLKEVGFADMNWIDVGRNAKTPTNLYDDETEFIKDILAANTELNVDDFYFIAITNDDDYYAFSKNPDDKKVYVITEEPYNLDTYESFEEFICEILNA